MPATSSPRRSQGVRPLPLTDVVLALATTTVAVLLGSEYHEQWRPLDAFGFVVVSLASLPIALRRRAPIGVLVACAVAWFCSITAGYWPALNPYGCMVALYTVAAQRQRRVALTAGAVIGSMWVYAGVLTWRTFGFDPVGLVSVLAQAVVFVGVVIKFGDNARQLAELNQQLADTSEQLRREQAERARQAVVEERVRIARELHDIVAHHMSVISIHAGMAGYVFDAEPGTARSAIGVIADNSREAQEELRRMLTLLRIGAETEDTADRVLPAPPGVARLDELVERMRAAGVPVQVTVNGRQQPLAAGPDLCVYRVIQESLTNVLKHAQPASATVELRYEPGQFTARVADDGRNAHHPLPRNDLTTGHGLTGMRERARLYGGTLTAGTRPTGGFQVLLTLPIVPDGEPATYASSGG